jgi:hypothetical protein
MRTGMRTVVLVASVLACAFSLKAQITTTFNRLPDGLDEVRIRNNSATSLVAFVVSVKQAPRSSDSPPALDLGASNAPFVVYSDPLIEPGARPLPPSEERVATVSGVAFTLDPLGRRLLPPFGRRLLGDSILTAGIYADGTTTGDAALLARLLSRRSNMLQAVEMALEMLSDAGRHNVPRDQLTEQFKKMAGFVSHWYLPPEQQVGRGLYQSIIGKLINLPDEPLGSTFPPSAFVAEETAMLNRQRVTLLESQPSLADTAFIGR